MHFRKMSKGEGVISNKKICCRFWTFKQGFWSMKWNKICNMIFRRWGGGEGVTVQRLFGSFPENSFVMVTSSVPKEGDLICQIQRKFFWRHNLAAVTLLNIKFLGLFLVFWKPNGSIWRSLSAIALPWFVQVTSNITKCISDLTVGGFCQSNCPNNYNKL